jgi:hypothetical protein
MHGGIPTYAETQAPTNSGSKLTAIPAYVSFTGDQSVSSAIVTDDNGPSTVGRKFSFVTRLSSGFKAAAIWLTYRHLNSHNTLISEATLNVQPQFHLSIVSSQPKGLP